MKQVKIESIVHDTHNVMHLKVEKPENLSFHSGQAVDVALPIPGWEKELRPFTFTSLPKEDHLEFYIKTYPDHHGVTDQIAHLKAGEHIMVGDVFGAIQYKGEGLFIAGGAGVTPFISIIRNLENQNKIGQNKLIFANKTEDDIIAKDLFNEILGNHFINVLSEEEKDGYEHGYINQALLEKEMKDDSYFYLCGPPPMMDAILDILKNMGIESNRIITEDF